jgi:hypothetical protein
MNATRKQKFNKGAGVMEVLFELKTFPNTSRMYDLITFKPPFLPELLLQILQIQKILIFL